MNTFVVNNHCLVAGIGSPHGDDQAGWHVAQRLRKKQCHQFEVRLISAPVELLDVIETLEYLVCLDAIEGGKPLGTIQRHVWPFEASWKSYNQSTHGMDLVTVLKVAESVGLLPAKVILWTIEGANWKPGTQMNLSVENKLTELELCVEQDFISTDTSIAIE